MFFMSFFLEDKLINKMYSVLNRMEQMVMTSGLNPKPRNTTLRFGKARNFETIDPARFSAHYVEFNSHDNIKERTPKEQFATDHMGCVQIIGSIRIVKPGVAAHSTIRVIDIVNIR
ncbi:uncharacterized protein [Rutidosis leptorrhynchoides]|uniref:uncharacterized protein n=1 Tax=Rutidosis leptorrhynchoides TaxID=125765 RepID=UPI003A9A1A68